MHSLVHIRTGELENKSHTSASLEPISEIVVYSRSNPGGGASRRLKCGIQIYVYLTRPKSWRNYLCESNERL
jgi:hypothetical protein